MLSPHFASIKLEIKTIKVFHLVKVSISVFALFFSQFRLVFSGICSNFASEQTCLARKELLHAVCYQN